MSFLKEMGTPTYFLNILAMRSTPMTRLTVVDMATPATPRGGIGPMPFIRAALPMMLRIFMVTAATMLSFMRWLLRSSAEYVSDSDCKNIKPPVSIIYMVASSKTSAGTDIMRKNVLPNTKIIRLMAPLTTRFVIMDREYIFSTSPS